MSYLVAPWSHTEDGDRADPINLVSDMQGVATIYNDLTSFQGSRWHPPTVADPIYLHFADQELQPEQQAVLNAFGSFRAAWVKILPSFAVRYHIRFWNLPQDTSLWRDGLPPEHYICCASAHVEDFFIHIPFSFELGEKFVVRQLKRAGYSVLFDAVPLGNQLQHPPNNGFATRVIRS